MIADDADVARVQLVEERVRVEKAEVQTDHVRVRTVADERTEVVQQVLRTGQLDVMVVRIGGDEFAFVQTEFAFADEVAERARAIEAALAAPFDIDGRAISINVSVGSSWACGIPDLPKLLGEADDALRARKRERKARRQATAPARSCATSIRRELTSSVI